jgi:transposase
MSLGTQQKQIDWRRSRVLELSSQGYSEREIANVLAPVHLTTVHRDLAYLRKQAHVIGR